jgi:hypothetical protein
VSSRELSGFLGDAAQRETYGSAAVSVCGSSRQRRRTGLPGFSRRPLSRAFRPFMGPIRRSAKGRSTKSLRSSPLRGAQAERLATI